MIHRIAVEKIFAYISNMPKLLIFLIVVVATVVVFTQGCSRESTRIRGTAISTERATIGTASYYDAGFAGKRTASGGTFDPKDLTAAHRTLPFGTRVRVTNLQNDRSVIVVITDRGPNVKGRLIDLSMRAAQLLGMIEDGIAKVRVEVLRD